MNYPNDIENQYTTKKEKTRLSEAGAVPMLPDAEELRLEFVVTNPANLDAAIQGLVQMIEQDEAQIAENKRAVNRLCERAGKPPLYSDISQPTSGQLGSIRPDQYYGLQLATAIRAILEARRAANLGAATVREIYDTLIKGGFKFEAKDENALRGLRQSLSKNSATFHKLPNGTYGLLEWYPGAKAAKPGEDDE